MLLSEGKKVITVDARKINHFGIGNVIQAVLEALRNSKRYAPLALGNTAEILRTFKDITSVNFRFSPNNPLSFFGLNRILHEYTPSGHIATFYVGVREPPVPSLLFFYDLIHLKYPRSKLHAMLSRFLMRRALKSNKVIVVLNQAVKNDIEKWFGRLKVDFMILRPPVKNSFRNLAQVKPEAITSQKEDFYLCISSSLKPHKGILELLNLWKSNWPLLVVAGNLGKVLANFTKPNIKILHGPLSEDHLVSLYLRAKYLVIPSYEEGFGYCFLESRFCYTPVIARPLSVFSDLATPFDALASDTSTPALAAAIEQSLNCSYNGQLIEDFKKIQLKHSENKFREDLECILDFLSNDSDSPRLAV